jgi:hypothetical protein
MKRRGDVLARRAWAEREERAARSDGRQPERVVGGAQGAWGSLWGEEKSLRESSCWRSLSCCLQPAGGALG